MGRIKLFVVGSRRADMSAADFHDHWRHPHGTWGQRMSTLRGYVQSHQIHTDWLGPEQSRYECVAEMWLDNEGDLAGFQTEPVFLKYLVPDAPNFVEPTSSLAFAAEEERLFDARTADFSQNPADDLWSPDDRPLSVKLLHFVRRDGNPAWAGANDASWGRAVQALRHVRCHPLSSQDPTAAPFLGARELWWPTLKAFREGVAAAPDAFQQLIRSPGGSITLLAQAERFI